MRFKATSSFVVVLLTYFSLTVLAAPKPLIGIAASVQDHVISTADLDQAVAQYQQALRGQGKSLPKQQMRAEILDHLIDRQLLIDQAKKLNITAAPDEIDRAVQTFARNHQQSVAQLQKNLKHEGKSLQSLRQQIAEQIMLSRVQLALLPDENKPTQNDVKRWLKTNQYKGLAFQLIDWHIPSESMPKNAAKETAESWFKLLRDAKAVVPSVIPGVQKHVMKLRGFADLPTLFAHALVKAKFNKTVGPILAENGYHVLQVVAKRGQVFTTDTAYQYLVGEAVEQHLPAILAKLKVEAYIQKFND